MRFNSYIVLGEGLTDREGHGFADAGIYCYWGRMGLTSRHKGQEKYHTRRHPEIATLEPVQVFCFLKSEFDASSIFRNHAASLNCPDRILLIEKLLMTQLSSNVSKVRFFCSPEKARLDTRSMIELGSASVLLLTLLATLGTAGLAHAKPSQNDFVGNLYASDPAPQSNTFPEGTVIIVDGRTLAGPNSSAQQRGGRLFLPIVSIARALGDSIQSDATSRVVIVRRQGGMVAEFSAQLNQVRENGSVTLTISATADIVFPPEVQELMLPVEIVAALLDVSIQREEGRAIRITRGGPQASTVRPGTEHAPFELYQLEYDYNASRYTSFFDHNLTLRGSGRLGDGRFTFLTNFDGGTAQSRLTNLHGCLTQYVVRRRNYLLAQCD